VRKYACVIQLSASCIYCLYNNAVSGSDCKRRMIAELVDIELENCRRKESWPNNDISPVFSCEVS
jgi:hypothetical protein